MAVACNSICGTDVLVTLNVRAKVLHGSGLRNLKAESWGPSLRQPLLLKN